MLLTKRARHHKRDVRCLGVQLERFVSWRSAACFVALAFSSCEAHRDARCSLQPVEAEPAQHRNEHGTCFEQTLAIDAG